MADPVKKPDDPFTQYTRKIIAESLANAGIAANHSGIAGLNTNTRTYLDTLAALRTKEARKAIQPSPDMELVRQRQAEYAKYLGQTDYAKQLQESQNMGKLQLALALAQRGFAAAGATPKRGESSVSTLSRELLSPLAGDAGSVASRMMQQKQAINAAKTAEERQLKLAALQKVEAENTQLKDLALKIMPKPKTSDMKQGNRGFARKRGPDGKPTGPVVPLQYTFDGENYRARTVGEGTQTSVTLGGTNPTHIVTNEKGEALGAAGTNTDKYTDNLIVVNRTTGKPVVDDQQKRIQVSRRGNELYQIGSTVVYDQPQNTKLVPVSKFDAEGTAATPKGLNDPKFQASFRGMLAQMGNIQERQELGTTAIRFDPVKFAANPGLKPGANYPFERVVGVNQSNGSVVTAPLEENQQKTYADNLRAGYLNTFDAIKTGDQKTEDLNSRFIGTELRKSFPALGLPDVPPTAGVVRGRDQITNPTAITAAYKNAVPGFVTDVQGTLDNLPFARSDANLRNGIARLVLFNELGVSFGQGTVSPPPISADSDAATVGQRAASIRELDADSIQDRIFAEKASKGTSMGSKLRTSTADSRIKQIAVVGEQLEAERARLKKAMDTPGAASSAEVLDKSLEMLAQLQKLDYDMKQSGATGFITGPLENTLRKYFGVSVRGYFTGPEGQQAANRFLASMPIAEQLFSRDILREAGEQRYTNQDLKGAQSVLIKINESDDFNADKLRQLTGYLKNLVKSGLNAAGTMDISPATLEKAAMLGIDLKSITPKNNYYSPYFNQGKYAVTNQPVPQYSKQYMDGLRDNGIFGYAKMRVSTGGAPMYKFIDVDNNGLPIPVDPRKPEKGFRTVVVSGEGNWKAELGPGKKKMLDYNRDYLLKTYGLDK